MLESVKFARLTKIFLCLLIFFSDFTPVQWAHIILHQEQSGGENQKLN